MSAGPIHRPNSFLSFGLSGCHPDITIAQSVKETAVATSSLAKTERIDVRASATVKQLLQEAARSSHKNVSEFLLDAGIVAANQALADRRHFVLTDEQWEAFQQALDAPPQPLPRLKKLMTEPGILD
jgi:uncharacterized protein (DUF1778 family)